MFRHLASRSLRNRTFPLQLSSFRGTKTGAHSHLQHGFRIPKSILVVGGVATTCFLVDEYYFQSLLRRSINAVTILSWVAYRYSNTTNVAEIQAFHEEAAESIFNMLARNKGLYIKLGQAVANQGAVFPVAFQKYFVNLYDAAPVEPWEVVDSFLKRELGENFETEIFEYIEHAPVASALIAQVHRAKLKASGEEVAVKIQHPYIAKQIPVDLAVYRLMSWVYSKIFDIRLTSITRYIAEQIVKETDFRNESSNSRQLAEYIANDPVAKRLNIYIPKCYDQFTTERVMVTEWIDGFSLTDKQKLIDASISLPIIMDQYINAFARQIFEYGFVHADPHPGNLLTRRVDGRQQLVILDHGLYVTLPKKFKSEYRNLWEAIFNLNMQEVDEIADTWGIGSSEFLKVLVQLKPPADTSHKVPNSLELMRELLGDDTKFPPDLMFIMRTMRMIQSLNQTMGSPVNRINILTKSAIYLNQLRRKNLIGKWFSMLKVKLLMFISDSIFLFFRARQIFLGDRYGGKGEGIEDYIEQHLKESARSMGIEIVEGL